MRQFFGRRTAADETARMLLDRYRETGTVLPLYRDAGVCVAGFIGALIFVALWTAGEIWDAVPQVVFMPFALFFCLPLAAWFLILSVHTDPIIDARDNCFFVSSFMFPFSTKRIPFERVRRVTFTYDAGSTINWIRLHVADPTDSSSCTVIKVITVSCTSHAPEVARALDLELLRWSEINHSEDG